MVRLRLGRLWAPPGRPKENGAAVGASGERRSGLVEGPGGILKDAAGILANAAAHMTTSSAAAQVPPGACRTAALDFASILRPRNAKVKAAYLHPKALLCGKWHGP